MTTTTIAPVICPRRDLLDALSACAVAVTAETRGVPQLQAVQLTSEPGLLHLTTTDLDTEVRASIPAPDVAAGLTVLVDHATLTRTVTALGKGERKAAADSLPIHLTLDTHLDVSAGGYTTPLEQLPISTTDRPEAPAIEATHLIDTHRFRTAATRVGHVVGTDPLLPLFTRINTTLGVDGITLAATDRYRAAEETVPTTTAVASTAGTATLPAKALTKLLRRASADTIGIGIGSAGSTQWTTLTSTNLRVTVRDADGEFPKLTAVINQGHPELATLDRARLSEASAKLAALDPDPDSYIELTGTPAGVTVNSRTTAGPTLADSTQQTSNWSTRLNPGYLQAALQALPTETVCLATSPTAVKPVTITSPELPDFVTVIMPLRQR